MRRKAPASILIFSPPPGKTPALPQEFANHPRGAHESYGF